MRQRSAVVTVLVLVTLLAGAGAAGADPGGPNAPASPAAASLLGTRFTYQGRLNSGSVPFTGSCGMAFRLYDDPTSGGLLVAGPLTKTALAVTDGYFTVPLDFGSGVFTGAARWLDIEVKCGADPAFTPLSPRQELTAAPYALALPGLYTQPNVNSPNLIGGYAGNTVTGTAAYGVTIAGGGQAGLANIVRGANATYATISGGLGNAIDGGNVYHSVIGGGFNNLIGGAATYEAAIGGGVNNAITGDHGDTAVIGGGNGNRIGGAISFLSVIGGGSDNQITGTFSARSVIGGGSDNLITGANAFLSVIGGGGGNAISGTNPYEATIAGGVGNVASDAGATIGGGNTNSAGSYGTVGGGSSNSAAGFFSAIPGGSHNSAQGQYSFAAGLHANALQDGSFVWADATGAVLSSTAANQFVVRASGGITLFSNPTATMGVELAPGAGAWTISSDRNLKTNYTAVDSLQVLNALAGVPIGTWNYKSQAAAIRHIGPMAQDFYAAFGVGETDTGINTVDGQGVALAAIQGLYRLAQTQGARLEAQQAQINDLQQRLATADRPPVSAGAPSPQTNPQLPSLGWLLFGALLLLNLGGLLGYGLARRASRPGSQGNGVLFGAGHNQL